MPRFQRKPDAAPDGDWLDLRDKRTGKLCARLNVKAMVLEIKRSDRELVAYFDLREYLAVLRISAAAEK